MFEYNICVVQYFIHMVLPVATGKCPCEGQNQVKGQIGALKLVVSNNISNINIKVETVTCREETVTVLAVVARKL